MPESIGQRIKELRTQRGMTLAEFGEKVKLSTGYLSQIERDKTAPSLSTLMDIARALDVGPRYFFEIETEAAYIQRADRVENTNRPESPVLSQQLTPGGSNKLEASRITLQPKSSHEPLYQFSGEEFIFVLEGELTVSVGDEKVLLVTGDSIHYDASQPRYFCNSGDEACVVIWGRAASPLDH